MTYAAQLIEAVKSACDYGSYKALAEALDVHEATLSNWRHNKGSPMPPERVMQLCEMARIVSASCPRRSVTAERCPAPAPPRNSGQGAAPREAVPWPHVMPELWPRS